MGQFIHIPASGRMRRCCANQVSALKRQVQINCVWRGRSVRKTSVRRQLTEKVDASDRYRLKPVLRAFGGRRPGARGLNGG